MTPGAAGPRAPRGARWSRLSASLIASGRGLGLCGLTLAGAGLMLALAMPVILAGAGIGIIFSHGHHGAGWDVLFSPVLLLAALVTGRFLTPSVLLAIRGLAVLTRRLCMEWCGVPIADPYRPPPGGAISQRLSFRQRLRWLLADPAALRDALWLTVNACGGWVLAAAPAGLLVYGLLNLVGGNRGHPVVAPPPALPGDEPLMLIVAGIALISLWLWAAPRLLRGYGMLARSMLGPSGRAELALRVAHLAQTRADTIDTGAAEMRRIERDLHDGAQARLVAMGMTLDAADHLLDGNPAAARALLAEARESSARALAELRDLVRGIHPPVLADRGLAEAVRALALDLPLRVDVSSELTSRPPAPVESAAYFAVNELLANVSKHADASQVWIDTRHDAGMLRIGVTDDGRGGADPARGTGLRGIERRLAAFDGVLAVNSPPGGPTTVTIEIPCAL